MCALEVASHMVTVILYCLTCQRAHGVCVCVHARACMLVVYLLSCVRLFCDPMDCSLPGSSVEFPRQEHRSGLPFPSPGDLPDPGIEPESPVLTGEFFTTEPPGKVK